MLPTVAPTDKHCYAAAEDVELGVLLLYNMATLLPKRSAGFTGVMVTEACAALFGCHKCFQPPSLSLSLSTSFTTVLV